MAQCSALCDYFAIIGYAPSSGLKQERVAEFGDSSAPIGPLARKSPLDTTYEPKVIAHFPTERPNRPFAPEIAALALPQGIRLRTERNVPREPSFHSFVVVREDGTRIYGCSLIFFEELRSSELRQQIFNAQLDYLREFASSSSSANSAFSQPPTINDRCSPEEMANDDRGLADQGQPTKAKPINHHPHHQQHISRKFTTHSLPRKLCASKRVGGAHSAVNFGEQSPGEEHVTYYKDPRSPLFISKCMAIVTPVPIIYSSENLLHNLWALINDKFPLKEYSLEDLLHWMLYELFLPSPAISMHLSFSDLHLLIRMPTADQPPFFDYPIETLFAHIGVEQFLKLLTCFMLEHQILIVSKNARNLMLIAECLSVLVLPFAWQMPYCPILPHTQLKFLEAPVPWLMGLCPEDDQLPEQLSQCNVCLLNVDTRQLEVPEDLPAFPRQHQIISGINELLRSSAETRKEQNGTEGTDEQSQVHGFYLKGLHFNQLIRDLFLAHFASLFSSYEGYLLGANSGDNANGLVQVQMPKLANNRRTRRNNCGRMLRESTANFDKISFLVDQPESLLVFLSAFLETQMFSSFIDTKILSSQNPSKAPNVQLFDQKIASLGNSKMGAQTAEGQHPANGPKDMDSKWEQRQFVGPTHGCCPSVVRPPKYGGFLSVPERAKLEFGQEMGEKLTMAKANEREEEEEQCNDENRQGHIQQQQRHPIRAEMPAESANNGENAKNGTGAKEGSPMRMAPHQNWRFVEQLLKETKAKTKRILVTKMGNEAVHLGHGQSISGLEENTLVASFCALLERIWSHGLKKKQGKSALWNYIIAYHEWGKRTNSKSASRRASTASTAEKDNHTPGDKQSSEGEDGQEQVPSALTDLISSIRRMTDGSGSRTEEESDQGPNGQEEEANWSRSLLRAANVICERISATGGAGSAEKSGQSCGTLLPPRPPSSRQRKKVIEEDQGITVADQEEAGRSSIKTEIKTGDESGEKQDRPKHPGSYRKFIYQGPLRPMNNNNNSNNQPKQKEQKDADDDRQRTKDRREARSRMPRSASSLGQGRWTTLISDLASHLSEDSLSRLALSSVGTDLSTPTRRRTRDLSAGAAHHQSPALPPRHRNRSLSRSGSPSRFYEQLTRGGGAELRTMNPLPSTMAYDLKNIMRMTEIKTDIGFARAFVRLALERKLLYHYLKKLLSNAQLLQKMYKRNSFLRCDEEREQFLFHLLSLNAVDFNCFTNSFLTIKMRYEVLLAGSLDRFPAGLVYIVLTGSHGCTSSIFLPANSVQFTFDLKNLGTLSTLRIGHSVNEKGDRNVRLSKWYLDYVLVRNCVTAQTFYFRCGRWFGRGIDDGALERLLVAEAIVARHHAEGEDGAEQNNGDLCRSRGQEVLQRPESPLAGVASFLSPRKAKYSEAIRGSQHRQRRPRSPSSDRSGEQSAADHPAPEGSSTGLNDQHQQMEHRVGMAVNALTKHFLTATDKNHQSRSAKLSTLLCSEDGGLLPSLDDIFSFGLVQRFFRQMYPWDYIEKSFVWFRQFFCSGESKKFTQEQRSLIIYTYSLVSKIAAHNAIGKEGKFHLFVLLCLRDHILPGLLPLLAWTPVTAQLYEQRAFLRQPAKLSYLAKLISTLNEFQFHYEKSLLQGIETL